MAPSISYEYYRGEEGLKEIWPQWEELLPYVEDVCFTHYPGWYAAYMNNLTTEGCAITFVSTLRLKENLPCLKFAFFCI